jgi:hypothetical protein
VGLRLPRCYETAVTDPIRAFAREHRYSAATIERWRALDPPDGLALLELAQELRLGENQLRDLWEWTEEIAQRDHWSLAQVLALEPVAAPRRNRSAGRNDRLKLIKAALRRLRFPQLAATEERLAGLVRELNLPGNIRVTFPEFLEGDDIRIEIVADSVASLKAVADRLQAAAEAPACTAIFQILEEAP